MNGSCVFQVMKFFNIHELFFTLFTFFILFHVKSSFQINTKFKDKYLSEMQWKSIKIIITNEPPQSHLREKVNKIIYFHFEKWAIHKAIQFKKRYYKRTQHISLDEMCVYTMKGLYNSIKMYDGKHNFVKYANILVLSSLYDCVTDLCPLNILPKYKRKSKVWKNKNKNFYINSLQPIFDVPDFYLSNKKEENVLEKYNNQEFYISLWKFIHSRLDEKSIYVFHLKYDFEFEKKQSNKGIASLLSCSEESIRKIIGKGHNVMKKGLVNKGGIMCIF